jgi:hypothetical protein
LDTVAATKQWKEWRAEAAQALKAARRQRQQGVRTLAEQGRYMSRLDSQRHAQRRQDEAKAAAEGTPSA